jgi:hypothetical protein
MPRWFVACLGLLMPFVLVQATPGSATRAFHDTVGEVDCCTRDLTDVVVRNDDAGRITFEIHFDDRVEGDDDDDLFIPLDTDRNNATGETGDWGNGVDYMIPVYLSVGQADGGSLYVWNGTELVNYPVRGIRLGISGGPRVVRVVVDRHLLGDTDGFDFNVQVWEVAHGNVYFDRSPDRGSWSFAVKIPTRRLMPSLRVTRRARAGKRFTARLALRVRATRRLLGSGRVLCRAAVAGARIEPVYAGFAGRRATCTWHVPAGTRGRTIRGSVGVAVTSRARISRRFAAVLR